MLNCYTSGLIDRWKCLEEAQRGILLWHQRHSKILRIPLLKCTMHSFDYTLEGRSFHVPALSWNVFLLFEFTELSRSKGQLSVHLRLTNASKIAPPPPPLHEHARIDPKVGGWRSREELPLLSDCTTEPECGPAGKSRHFQIYRWINWQRWKRLTGHSSWWALAQRHAWTGLLRFDFLSRAAMTDELQRGWRRRSLSTPQGLHLSAHQFNHTGRCFQKPSGRGGVGGAEVVTESVLTPSVVGGHKKRRKHSVNSSWWNATKAAVVGTQWLEKAASFKGGL